METSTSRLQELVAAITENTAIYRQTLAASGQPEPSFSAVDTLTTSPLPPGIVDPRNKILEACEELQALVVGPTGHLQRQTTEHTSLISLHAIVRFRIANRVPLEGETSYRDLAGQIDELSESHIRRLLRHAMTKHIFAELRPGYVAHTAASRVLHEDEALRNKIEMICEEMWPAAARTVNAMIKWEQTEEPEHSGWALANGASRPMFAELETEPARAERFAKSMTLKGHEEGLEPFHLLNAYDWNSWTSTSLVFVDVGGSHGTVSQALASKFENVHCVVQDFPNVINEAEGQLPLNLSGRVEFMAHDFFADQPVKDADVYFFRWIFHDWSDKYCVKLLRALIPALKKGARVVLSDFVIPEKGAISKYQEGRLRAFDMVMMELFNSKEREKWEWQELFAAADDRFRFVGITQPQGSKLSFIEAQWGK